MKSCNLFLLLSILIPLIMITLFPKITEGTVQEVTLYSGENCTGESFSIRNTQNITSGSWPARANYLRITGLWDISFRNDGEGVNMTVTALIMQQPISSGALCQHKNKVFFTIPDYFTRFEKLGPSDTSTSQLLLFEDGTTTTSNIKPSLIVTEEQQTLVSLNLNFQTISRVAHFSNDTWVAHSEPGFKGTKHCFYPVFNSTYNGSGEKGTSVPKDGLQYYSVETKLKVGSVKKDEDNKICPGFRSSSSADLNFHVVIQSVAIIILNLL